MKRTSFYILLSQKNYTAFTSFGEFWLGSNKEQAESLFSLLEGSDNMLDQALIHFDFVETVDGLPMKIRTVCCTLDEYTRNCRTIVKETFKRLNLEGGMEGLG